MGKQWIAQASAPIDDAKKWHGVDWKAAHRKVRKLQMRIAKAVKESRWNKVKTLQYLLSRSLYAKLLAVKRVTSNKGRKTPGVDGVVFKGARCKWRAADNLKRHGYKPKPLRRIYISKKNGKKRPLSIPCMYDRAMQALYKLALAPIAETTADQNSYGFRELRRCADAIGAAFNALSKPNSATWILEADITGCYDNICPDWILKNIPMDKEVLRKWLKAGYIEDGKFYPSRKGTPQGGIISPMIANMTLDGLEQAIHNAVPRRSRVNFIRYADDFIVTAKSKRLIEEHIKPVIESFLKERGLSLSQEKTKTTYIKKGFTFLGQTFRKHGRVLRIIPSKEGVLSIIRKIGTVLNKYVSAPMITIIKKLNQVIRGWGNYHQYILSSKVFWRIDRYVYAQLWRMLHKRHSSKSQKWLYQKYWTSSGKKNIFSIIIKSKKKSPRIYQVVRLWDIGIKRYIKIRAAATPYQKEYAAYYWKRRHEKEAYILPAKTAREYRAMKAA